MLCDIFFDRERSCMCASFLFLIEYASNNINGAHLSYYGECIHDLSRSPPFSTTTIISHAINALTQQLQKLQIETKKQKEAKKNGYSYKVYNYSSRDPLLVTTLLFYYSDGDEAERGGSATDVREVACGESEEL